MLSLLFIAFIGGFLTIAAPCILAVLPIILGSTIGHQSKFRPIAIVVGLTLSFTGFGILFTYVTNLFGISSETLRTVALLFLAIFGLALIFPGVFEKVIFELQQFAKKLLPTKDPAIKSSGETLKEKGVMDGFLVGASLGLVWVPCAGPILGAILTLAVTQADLGKTVLLMLFYSLGAGIPMLTIAYGGNLVINKLKFLKQRGEQIKKLSGIVLLVGVAFIALGLDVKIQTALYSVFPQFTKFEEKLLQQTSGELGSQKSAEQNSPAQTNVSSEAGNIPLLEPTQKAPELTGNQGWVNSEPLKLSDLKGKVVIIDFWTYSCINCIRTLPYISTWHKTYKDEGLVIIGVHTPEFPFEKDLNNVKKAIKDYGIEYPVVQDNEFKTWLAYDNHYWPAKYIIDKNGFIRYTHFGEGQYEETEKVIRQLLAEGKASSTMPEEKSSSVQADNVDFRKIETRETYIGYEREEAQGNKEAIIADKEQTFKEPAQIETDMFYLVGKWIVGPDSAKLSAKNGKIIINYKASQANLVMNGNGKTLKARVLLDGKLIAPGIRGADVAADGTVTIKDAKLYSLVDTKDQYERHTLTLEFSDSGVEAFAFTFG
ncbi:cytochrome c biogenesis protein DipZ [Candidatus Peregrinibacteria bacterium]|nr:cytochrome c biogenesis protein DipZ [Candidatus Peregrinibacteria bacterium]